MYTLRIIHCFPSHVLDEASMSWLGEAPTMLVGIDVTHPGISSIRETPSIAAVVASVDRDCVHFPASLRMQESKKEVCVTLDVSLYCLRFYRS
jgi:eukaryotic translation initiation factor 2C